MFTFIILLFFSMFKNSPGIRGTEFTLNYSESRNQLEKLLSLEKWNVFPASELSVSTEGTMKVRRRKKKLVKKISKNLNE